MNGNINIGNVKMNGGKDLPKVYSVYEQPPFSPMPKIFSMSFEGRYGRLNYIKANLLLGLREFLTFALLGFFVFSAVHFYPNLTVEPALYYFIAVIVIAALAVLIPGVIYQIRCAVLRLHDLNKSGTWFLFFMIPFVNMAFALYLLVSPGTKGVNDFGFPSLQSSKVYLVVMVLLSILTFIIYIALILYSAAAQGG
jgi:uncharacterized membrane protein YhaH (DUF805 family)